MINRYQQLNRRKRFLRKRVVAGALFVVSLAIAALVLCSCGGTGSVAFDGGHIPIGGGAGSRISGVAVAAEDMITPLSNVTITVTNTALTGATSVQSTTTASDGTFNFPAFPNGPGASAVFNVVAEPATGSNRTPQHLQFPVVANVPQSMLIAVPTSSVNAGAGTSIQVVPGDVQMHSGDTILVSSRVLDASGTSLGVGSSLVLSGAFGSLAPGGYLTGAQNGTGTLMALWDTGSSQLQKSENVVSNTTTPHQPPPPPISIPGSRRVGSK